MPSSASWRILPSRAAGRSTSATTSQTRPAWRPRASSAARACALPKCLAESRRPCAPGSRVARSCWGLAPRRARNACEALRDQLRPRRDRRDGERGQSGNVDSGRRPLEYREHRAVPHRLVMIAERTGVVSQSHDCRACRFAAAIDRGKRLVNNGAMMRYRVANDFGKCAFWYIDALLELFNYVLACRNHASLLSEDIDGPQTYSQVGLILSAMCVSRSSEEGLWDAS